MVASIVTSMTVLLGQLMALLASLCGIALIVTVALVRLAFRFAKMMLAGVRKMRSR